MIVLLWLGCTEPPPPIESATCDGTLAVHAAGLVYTADGCARVELAHRAVGDGDLAVSLALVDGAIVPTVTSGSGGTLRALVLEGTWSTEGEAAARIWRQGYQSWSWSGVLDPVPLERDADGIPVAGGDGDALSVATETGATSWWAGLVGRPGDGHSVLLGALAATRTKVVVGFDGDAAIVTYGGRGEAIGLAAGESVTLDPLWIGSGRDAYAVWRDYADAVARQTPPRPVTAAPPVGWASWYELYDDVTEADVRANVAAADGLGPDRAGLDVIQVDDGWEVRWGDWTANEKFPSGMGALAADLRAAGYTPGLWMAPFYVSRDSATYQQNPDWWVRDHDGDELVFNNVGTGDYAVIDVTHPDAAAWLAAQIRGRVDEGWTWLKLDFLYAGAQEGLRREPVTGIEAYHVGMRILREAAGDDTHILACGAPLLPSVGYADSYRSGADIAFTVAPDPVRAHMRWQARSTAARGWANGVWWWNDPDQLLVREPLTIDEARGAAVANVVSGGSWLLGDDLAGLSDDRLDVALDPDWVATRGVAVRPVDPLSFPSGLDGSPLFEAVAGDDTAPVTWILADGHVALLNLGDAPVEGLAPPGVELGTGETSPVHQVRTIPPGGGELWRVAR